MVNHTKETTYFFSSSCLHLTMIYSLLTPSFLQNISTHFNQITRRQQICVFSICLQLPILITERIATGSNVFALPLRS
jgi:hypothetical protein